MPGYLSVGLNMCVQLPDRKYNKVQILKIDVVIKGGGGGGGGGGFSPDFC